MAAILLAVFAALIAAKGTYKYLLPGALNGNNPNGTIQSIVNGIVKTVNGQG